MHILQKQTQHTCHRTVLHTTDYTLQIPYPLSMATVFARRCTLFKAVCTEELSSIDTFCKSTTAPRSSSSWTRIDSASTHVADISFQYSSISLTLLGFFCCFFEASARTRRRCLKECTMLCSSPIHLAVTTFLFLGIIGPRIHIR